MKKFETLQNSINLRFSRGQVQLSSLFFFLFFFSCGSGCDGGGLILKTVQNDGKILFF